MITKELIADWFKGLQDDICQKLEAADGTGKFQEENWVREEGGGGRSRVLQNGTVLEKGGVMFSAVHGDLPEAIQRSFKVEKTTFFATGVSIVIHPNHPLVPIIHMNVRYFETPEAGLKWFGGGIDLTPHYVNENDARFFHQALKGTCDQFHHDYYTQFKHWADDYFFIKHRNETRGVGGIFFDRLGESEHFTLADRWEFVKSVGETFAKVYVPLIERNKDRPFTEEQKNWQLLRRSRYVEFNLVYDAGTKFGLETNGRIESILMSMPPQANWAYNYQPVANSDEAQTLSLLKKGINWV
ncbi:oxygen-dependent coproporphyrinogen oxidase [Solitalea canadensis]|uniref:coproporphyrinogen oxidase n=1 Tax=Solitalea canadensis (strain ATCC 29591 / DSM 3403 / JCM 21819 / LMG 8368 / NBRC 15130 / NCIMB 12057 / USAM 9D) TaxID=929556 RepID=H8KVL7_SOLCM|nr:oxygen-dependent coproporphyrinogen oxidase [Solitalea canadensis]AFD06520.1 coproporphyrinogen III oxidase [Solitalea canadensis DSM 3403]